MAGPDPSQRRAHYRLRYPDAERPLAHALNSTFRVAELSELGMRLLVADGEPAVGAAVSGYVRFHDGQTAETEGIVLRHDAGEAILRLTVGVPFRRMLAEQQRLIRLYPFLFERPSTEST